MFPIQVDLVDVSFFLFLALVVALAGGVVYLTHRQEVLRIETGNVGRGRSDRRWVLAVGLVLVAVGVGQSVEALLVGNLASLDLTLAAVGLAALAYYYLVGREERAAGETADGDDRPAR